MEIGQIQESYDRAVALMSSGDEDGAAALFREILEHEPASPETQSVAQNIFFAMVHNNLGVIASSKGDNDTAADCFRSALDFAPGHVESITNLGTLRELKGNIEGAVEFYRQALDLRDDFEPARLCLARCLSNAGSTYFSQGDLEDSLRCYEEAREVTPGDPSTHSNIGLVHQRCDRPEEAIVSYKRALAIDPRFEHALGNLADIYVNLERPDEARPLAEAGLEWHPRSALLNLTMAKCHRVAGEYEDAIARLTPLANPAASDRLSAEVYLELMKNHDALGNQGDAERCMRIVEGIAGRIPGLSGGAR